LPFRATEKVDGKPSQCMFHRWNSTSEIIDRLEYLNVTYIEH
jgi:hypothetical protein